MNCCNGEHKNLEINKPCVFLASGKWVTICGHCIDGSNYKNEDDFPKRIKRLSK